MRRNLCKVDKCTENVMLDKSNERPTLRRGDRQQGKNSVNIFSLTKIKSDEGKNTKNCVISKCVLSVKNALHIM